MKLFRLFLSLFVIVGLILITSLFFPHTYHIERSQRIAKPVGEVFSFMSDLKNWEKWSLWNKDTDSTIYYYYGKTSKGIEARQYFGGKLLGSGRFKFDTVIENQKLVYNLYMHAGEVKANGTFLFSGDEQGTTLTWLDYGDVGYNPVYRFMIPSKVSSTEKTFDEGLLRIKQVLEK